MSHHKPDLKLESLKENRKSMFSSQGHYGVEMLEERIPLENSPEKIKTNLPYLAKPLNGDWLDSDPTH